MQKNWIMILLAFAVVITTDAHAQKKKKRTDEVEDTYIFKVDRSELDEQSLFIEAVNEKELGNLQEAVGLFNAVLKIDPKNHAALYELARIAYETNDLVTAEEYARKAVALHPRNEWYHIYLAEARAHQGNYSGAAEAYRAIYDEMPGMWEYLQDVGYMYARAGEYEKAIEVYNELESFQGISEPLSLQKESIYLKMGKVDKAADEIRRLIDEFPDRDNLYILLGEVYEANDYHKKALESYQLLLDKEPEHPQALLSIAEVQRKMGDAEDYQATVRKVFGNASLDIDTKIFMFIPYIEMLASDSSKGEEVLQMAELIRKVHPDDAKAQTAYADVLLNMGRNAEALEAYKEAVKYDESPITVWIQLFDMLMQDENYDELIEYGHQAIERYPEDVAPRFYVGAACLQRKDYSCTIDQYSKALSYHLVNAELQARMWSTMGDAYNEMKDHVRSDSCYEEALIINPNDAFTLNNYAYYLSLRDDQLEKAKRMSKRSNLLMESNAAFLDTYAWILYQLEEYDEALEWMDKAIDAMRQTGPDRPVLLEHYGDILFRLGRIEDALDYWQKALEAGGDESTLVEKIRSRALLE